MVVTGAHIKLYRICKSYQKININKFINSGGDRGDRAGRRGGDWRDRGQGTAVWEWLGYVINQ